MNELKQSFSIDFNYPIVFTKHLFALDNDLLEQQINQLSENRPAKIAFVVDDGVAEAHPDLLGQIKAYIEHHRATLSIAGHPLVIRGGEVCKNSMNEVLDVLELIHKAGVDRHAYVVAIGGGALLDMAGFAAAIAHRGVRHIRIPTTVLSQNDSGIGVKNGINFFGKKNFLGTFAVPSLVINDIHFLTTLSERDWRAGISEAVKVALLKDPIFYQWIEENAEKLASRDLDTMAHLIRECAILHAAHIAGSGDPFEYGSSRPLDFGHWAAHKLEQLTDYALRHGEAVAIGLALDVTYAAEIGMLDHKIADQIVDVLQAVGFQTFDRELLDKTGSKVNPLLVNGLEEFREHLGGQLTVILIEKIGAPVEVHTMDILAIERSVLRLAQKSNVHAN